MVSTSMNNAETVYTSPTIIKSDKHKGINLEGESWCDLTWPRRVTELNYHGSVVVNKGYEESDDDNE